MSLYTIETEFALVEEIVAAAASKLDRAQHGFDADGDLAGVVYYDASANRYYAADVDGLRQFVDVFQHDRSSNAYSLWCAESTPEAEGETREDVLAEMGWTA